MIIYGKQVVLYVLEKYPTLIKEVIFSKKIDDKTFSKFLKLGLKIQKVDNQKAQALANGGNHQGFFLDIDIPEQSHLKYIKDMNFILVLDGLTDMGNIGAIIRSAYSLGVESVIITGIKDLKIENIIRSSSGALLDMPYVVVPNALDVANELSQVGFTLLGADMDGEDIKNFDRQNKKIALFLGSEGRGLSNKVIKKLDQKLSIKMANNFDSLNVSVAAGILIHELRG